MINQDHKDYYLKSIQNINDKRLLPLYRRKGTSDSEKKAYLLKAYKPDKVLIHDAARPFVSNQLIHRVIDKLKVGDAVLPVRSLMLFGKLKLIVNSSYK